MIQCIVHYLGIHEISVHRVNENGEETITQYPESIIQENDEIVDFLLACFCLPLTTNQGEEVLLISMPAVN